mmetsp:Transcript_12274/g.18599  ORF Transcript_12274/g.18599 Transcript_12274/m.18599 type:complete len:120 (+) Transcript_12274:66-425(+)|eukprot:CAMPEP_0185017658 /NCGR_PEP_ID=MMETSP1103-20130426/580_1 /TAXON_ID=36769 /ORGANISM="Paraphysomonas bandaiensis, Strain Caron Lab Isolate" /LENGTH=119 /DNA_ID=CAMNT_0027547169 /DNA_START=36 /DNA_END=395 /DNA_ORIENTATION=-
MASIKPLTPIELSNIVNDNDECAKYQIVDVREPHELLALSIENPNIMNLPLSKAEEWQPSVAESKILSKDKPVVCLCRSGGRSMKFATFLSSVGYPDIYNVEGGMMAYANEVESGVKRS